MPLGGRRRRCRRPRLADRPQKSAHNVALPLMQTTRQTARSFLPLGRSRPASDPYDSRQPTRRSAVSAPHICRVLGGCRGGTRCTDDEEEVGGARGAGRGRAGQIIISNQVGECRGQLCGQGERKIDAALHRPIPALGPLPPPQPLPPRCSKTRIRTRYAGGCMPAGRRRDARGERASAACYQVARER
eukprot:365381-Chlamydomonas_euryale.AAC.13